MLYTNKMCSEVDDFSALRNILTKLRHCADHRSLSPALIDVIKDHARHYAFDSHDVDMDCGIPASLSIPSDSTYDLIEIDFTGGLRISGCCKPIL